MSDNERIQSLEKELASLRQDVSLLRAELQGARQRMDLTMRGQTRCPGCGGRRIYHAESVLDRSDSGRGQLALAQPSIWRSKGAGELEAYVCEACGLVEWYVRDTQSLADHPQHFTLLDGGSDQARAPYR